MDINQLNVFVYVYKTKSFSIAAKNLFLTQPTVSSHISNLEKELSCRLFYRSTKKVEPTEKAHKLYKYAVDLIKMRDEILHYFYKDADKLKVLTFGSSTIPSKYLMPIYMNSFKKIHNDIIYNQIYGSSKFLISHILSNSLDFAFIGKKIDDNNIEYTPFYSDRLVFIMPNNSYYKKILNSKNPILHLLNEPIIVRKSTKSENKQSDNFLHDLGYTNKKLNIVAYINDQDQIYNAVSSGKGISLFSKIAAKNYKPSGDILIYNPILHPLRRNLYIAYKKDTELTPIANEFIEFVKNNSI